MDIKITKNEKTAILFGATGLVGGHVLNYLLTCPSYKKVLLFSRSSANVNNPKVEEHLIDFDNLIAYSDLIKGNDLFLCLGTTIAKAGNREAFTKVDFLYPNLIAKIAKENKINQVFLVSAIGAATESMFFYNRVKGKLEEALIDLEFWSLHIFRPSVLLGKRKNLRFGEHLAAKIGKRLDELSGGMFAKIRPIEAYTVAKAMVEAAQGVDKGVHICESNDLQKLADQETKYLREM